MDYYRVTLTDSQGNTKQSTDKLTESQVVMYFTMFTNTPNVAMSIEKVNATPICKNCEQNVYMLLEGEWLHTDGARTCWMDDGSVAAPLEH